MVAPYDILNPLSWSGSPLSLYSFIKKLNAFEEISTINLSDYIKDKDRKHFLYKNIDLLSTIKNKSLVTKSGSSTFSDVYAYALNKKVSTLLKGDVMLQLGGFKVSDNIPYYIYSDSLHDMKLWYYDKFGVLPCNSTDNNVDFYKRGAEHVHNIYRDAECVFCMSEWMADILKKYVGLDESKISVVYAGANCHGYSPCKVKEKVLTDNKTVNICFTGVDFKLKGCSQLIKAVNLLNTESEKEYFLTLAGVTVADAVNKEDLNDHIKFLGYVNKNELYNMLDNNDIFVLPSNYDCFGISFIEAMSRGLPAIGRNVCAMPEIIESGKSGELVSDETPESLAELIVKITKSPLIYTQYSKEAIKKAKQFSWNNTSRKITDRICADN